MDITDDNLKNKYCLPKHLNAECYEEYLREEMFGLVEEVPLGIRNNMLYHHYGCLAHCRNIVWELLDNHFP